MNRNARKRPYAAEGRYYGFTWLEFKSSPDCAEQALQGTMQIPSLLPSCCAVVQTMNRREAKRKPKRIAVLLSSGECVSTENISHGGARVRTVRPWKPDAHVVVKTAVYELRAEGRVIYCQSLPDTTFAVGLEFPAPTIRMGHGDHCLAEPQNPEMIEGFVVDARTGSRRDQICSHRV